LRVFGLELLLRDAAFVHLADAGHAAIQRVLLRVENRHRDTGIGKGHGDAATHGAGTDHRDVLDLSLRRAITEPVDLARGALGEERMAQRLRFGTRHELGEDPALDGHALVERLAH
jgi:hypothetical protein